MSTALTINPAFPTLGRTASFWVSAAVVAHTLWTSAAPAMTYPLYAAEWNLTPTATTAIFAVYPIVVVAVLIAFGDISDYIGRRTTMLIGLFASLIGVMMFALAPDVVWVFIGRAFMGVGVGLSASPATAAMVEFSPAGQSKRASSITTAAQSLGLTLATLVGGGLIQYAPFPTHLNFGVLASSSPRCSRPPGSCRVIHRPKHPDAGGRKSPPFARSCARFSRSRWLPCPGGFALGSLLLSLGSQIAHDLVGVEQCAGERRRVVAVYRDGRSGRGACEAVVVAHVHDLRRDQP